jgi:hypothetical protein
MYIYVCIIMQCDWAVVVYGGNTMLYVICRMLYVVCYMSYVVCRMSFYHNLLCHTILLCYCLLIFFSYHLTVFLSQYSTILLSFNLLLPTVFL